MRFSICFFFAGSQCIRARIDVRIQRKLKQWWGAADTLEIDNVPHTHTQSRSTYCIWQGGDGVDEWIASHTRCGIPSIFNLSTSRRFALLIAIEKQNWINDFLRSENMFSFAFRFWFMMACLANVDIYSKFTMHTNVSMCSKHSYLVCPLSMMSMSVDVDVDVALCGQRHRILRIFSETTEKCVTPALPLPLRPSCHRQPQRQHSKQTKQFLFWP